ncbi:MAG: hypothetical protein NVS3B28_09920 [Candidatus Velthaea sp.]
MNDRVTLARDFERESHRIDQDIWDAMALRAGETVLFCGFHNDLDWIARAIGVGVRVSVIESAEAAIAAYGDLDIAVLKGSTTMIPARDASFDAAVAFHYLHEIDPFFDANVVSELARVGKRLIVVEPAPPVDPLGLRIAMLYSRAKRELGQFEYYQHVDYWKKLLSIVKADVVQHVFSFNRTPPRDAIKETVSLILDTMAAEATPEPYLAELRALALRPDAQLVPQSRYVLVGALAGLVPAEGAGTRFREAPEPESEPESEPIRLTAPVAPTIYETATEPEMPPVVPAAVTPVEEAILPFGFGVPGIVGDPLPRSGFGWEWEPPEDPAREP